MGKNLNGKQVDYEKYLVSLSGNRKPSIIAELCNLVALMPSDTTHLGVGSPNSLTFPFKEINVTLKDGSKISINDPELRTCLQYLPDDGYPPLIELLKDLQDKNHGPQNWENKHILVTNGAQEGTYKAISMLLAEGDPILIQNPVYAGFADIMIPLNVEFLTLKGDKDGTDPVDILRVLKNREKSNLKMPRVLYINPTGSNPTGTLLSFERKKQIYKIAQEYDLIILEDDPYFFVHYLEENPRSMLSIDTDNRVLRFDSFSKCLSAGLRLGFVTGPLRLIEPMRLHIQISTMHTSGISQVIAYRVLAHWGEGGFKKHLSQIRAFYKERRDNMLKSVEKHLTGLAKWDVPLGGFFIWLTLPPINDLRDVVMNQCLKAKVVVTPGYTFNMDPTDKTDYVRLSYSAASMDQVDEGIRKFAELIKRNLKT